MTQLSRLIIKGGVLSPAELKKICEVSEDLGFETISFGSRQDVLFPEENKKMSKEVAGFQVVNSTNDMEENIMSSYVSSDIFPSTTWLTSDKYLYVLEQFRKASELKINITDPKQRLVPLFTGHLNFIASEYEDYWYLYVRLPYWNTMEIYPALIYSWDIEKITRIIEELLKEELDTIQLVFDLVNHSVDMNNRTIDESLKIPFHPFPYYEGMNRIGNDKYWLGLYWRNNKYDLTFLKAMCDLCFECKIGKISITPWKSFIIKDIPGSTKLRWEKFLGRYGINVRHSMLELNWHIPVGNSEALELKKYLVRNFDKNDISTYGLTFGITDYVKTSYYFTSIVIERNSIPDELKEFNIRSTYNLLHAKNFDPNTREYITSVREVDKEELPDLLIELSRLYFEQLGAEKEIEYIKKEESKEEVEVYQCKHCQLLYEEQYGDKTQGVPPNTPFESLTEDYKCSLCEANKDSFEKITLKKIS
ncbi:Nitrite/Sulfite reductase ferredoxin-like half domain-containing protein [Tenacibaculum sp. MAR_2009_124]|uniref:rubredoxin n=1 Tax=Tenacibaculum sp. MAR_2009_124 TaxID=1250059 RepID=UPI00089901D4|nr:rubredoxin [Tenacibaculum sp. MAR_2009_124]SEC23262.1 Nitrite/Sulfite reductase ferredoxin-like half domain-containing protein [Tenacibaculum sp. MAR_2009_124]